MKNLMSLLLMLPLNILAQTPVIYNLPGTNLNSQKICGKQKVCDPGPIRGIVYRFSRSPYSPNVDDNSTPQTIAASILGRAVSVNANDKDSERPQVCSKDGFTSLITINDVTATGGYGVAGKSFVYTKNYKFTIDAKVAAQATIDKLKVANIALEEALYDTLKAKLEAIYKNIKTNELIVTANYSEWSLKDPAMDRIMHAPEFQDCREKLKANNWAYITDIGLIKYSISLNNANIRTLAVDITAELKRKGFNIDMGALIEKETHKTLTSNVQGYQIIGWRKSAIQ